MRCISSINNISPSFNVDKMAAKSPVFSIEGPLIKRIPVPISFAITYAKVVLPSPGGPYSKI